MTGNITAVETEFVKRGANKTEEEESRQDESRGGQKKKGGERERG